MAHTFILILVLSLGDAKELRADPWDGGLRGAFIGGRVPCVALEQLLQEKELFAIILELGLVQKGVQDHERLQRVVEIIIVSNDSFFVLVDVPVFLGELRADQFLLRLDAADELVVGERDVGVLVDQFF